MTYVVEKGDIVVQDMGAGEKVFVCAGASEEYFLLGEPEMDVETKLFIDARGHQYIRYTGVVVGLKKGKLTEYENSHEMLKKMKFRICKGVYQHDTRIS